MGHWPPNLTLNTRAQFVSCVTTGTCFAGRLLCSRLWMTAKRQGPRGGTCEPDRLVIHAGDQARRPPPRPLPTAGLGRAPACPYCCPFCPQTSIPIRHGFGIAHLKWPLLPATCPVPFLPHHCQGWPRASPFAAASVCDWAFPARLKHSASRRPAAPCWLWGMRAPSGFSRVSE